MLTQDRLKEVLRYEPDTGIFINISPRKGIAVGSIAGYVNRHGYRQIMVDQKYYAAHRLAWLYVTGAFPDSEIDHRNTVRSDNRWKNLRQATSAQNKWNTSLRRDNSSGAKGCNFDRKKRKWQARIEANGLMKWLGYFETLDQAKSAYDHAATEMHGEFMRSQS